MNETESCLVGTVYRARKPVRGIEGLSTPIINYALRIDKNRQACGPTRPYSRAEWGLGHGSKDQRPAFIFGHGDPNCHGGLYKGDSGFDPQHRMEGP